MGLCQYAPWASDRVQRAYNKEKHLTASHSVIVRVEDSVGEWSVLPGAEEAAAPTAGITDAARDIKIVGNTEILEDFTVKRNM